MTWTWALFAVYAVATAALALRSSRGTESAKTFALGDGHMHWGMAGITLGACLASSATFVLAPGFVYAEGLPALIGFSVPLVAGIAVGLGALAFRFQDVGGALGALTLPHLLGARYESDGLRRLFSALNVLNVAYLITIVVGCGYVMEAALGVPYRWAVVGIVGFVFAYTGLGGATAHAWTNSLQGGVMLLVSVVVFLAGAHRLPEVAADLATTGLVAPGSVLFSTSFEVWVVMFAMGFALATQPHLLCKALYVQDRRDLRRALVTGVLSFTVFCLVLFAGAYARLDLAAGVPQDRVMATWLAATFGAGPVGAFVSVAILAAAMSTLDGLLVAIAASVGNDLLPGRGSVWGNRAVLAVLAVATIGVALSPPRVVLLLGQLGVYGLVAASAGPLLAGLLLRGKLPAWAAGASATVALAVHFGSAMFLSNPGLSALAALCAGVPVAVVPALIWRSDEVLARSARSLPT